MKEDNFSGCLFIVAGMIIFIGGLFFVISAKSHGIDEGIIQGRCIQSCLPEKVVIIADNECICEVKRTKLEEVK